MYAKYVKRFLDFIISLVALILLSPMFLILMIAGTLSMKGNPFFTQDRPGWHEKIFKLVKFRTMSNARDKDGNLLPDEKRLNAYGKFLRSTSLDELPEFFNIIKGDMSLIGPRPLLVGYLDYYNDFEMRRHEVRPGLTGLTQVSGRRGITWGKKFEKDIEYVDNITFLKDMHIILLTVKEIFTGAGVENFKENQFIMDYFTEHGDLRAGEGEHKE